MRLTIVTPMKIVLDTDDVILVRAEDRTGSFGVQPRHASFLTVLGVSILKWKNHNSKEHYAALRSAVFQIHDQDHIEIAARDAVLSDSLERLRETVLVEFSKKTARESMSRTSSAQLNLAVIRRLQEYLEAGRSPRPATPFGAVSDNLPAADAT